MNNNRMDNEKRIDSAVEKPEKKPFPQKNEVLNTKDETPALKNSSKEGADISHKRKQGLFASLRNSLARLKIQEKINFARHLAIVIQAGIPLYTGLSILSSQSSSKTLSRIVKQLMIDVDNGKSLSDGLARFRHIFNAFFINMVRVGESSGTLAQNLIYLSDELKKSESLKRKVRSAMIYPVIIAVVALLVTSFLAFFVFPKLLPILSGLDVELPAITVAVIKTVEFLRNYSLYLIFGTILLIFGIRFINKKVTSIRYIVHKSIFYIPIVSDLVVSYNITNLSRILGLLLKSGVKIVDAINILSGTFTNEVYKRALLDSVEQVKKGERLAEHLATHKRIFPPLFTGMVGVGEGTGNLESNLFYLSEYYSEEVDNKLTNLTAFIEPIMLLVMGSLVGLIALSIILPIYKITSSI